MAALGIEEKGAAVVTAAEGWHPGVVGLVAARLKERFGRPAFAIALEPGGIGTGSGRSIAGRRSRPRGAAGGGRGAPDQGRRPRHGGGRHAAQGRAGGLPRLPRRASSAMRSRRRGATTRSRSTARSRRRLRPPRRSRPSPRPGRSAPAIPSRWWRCRRIRSPMPTRSGRRMCGCGCARATAPGVNAIAFRAVGPEARRGADGEPRAQRACRGLPRDRPLAGRGAGAVPDPGRGARIRLRGADALNPRRP